MSNPHKWITSTLGHGGQMCENCHITMAEASVLGRMNECDGKAQPDEDTPNPTHEPEVEEKKARQLYTSILDTLNEEQGVSMGHKIEVLAQVLTSMSRTMERTAPGEGEKVLGFFFATLAVLDDE